MASVYRLLLGLAEVLAAPGAVLRKADHAEAANG